MRATSGSCGEARLAHRGLALGYGRRIAALRDDMGAPLLGLGRVS